MPRFKGQKLKLGSREKQFSPNFHRSAGTKSMAFVGSFDFLSKFPSKNTTEQQREKKEAKLIAKLNRISGSAGAPNLDNDLNDGHIWRYYKLAHTGQNTILLRRRRSYSQVCSFFGQKTVLSSSLFPPALNSVFPSSAVFSRRNFGMRQNVGWGEKIIICKWNEKLSEAGCKFRSSLVPFFN